MPDNMSPDNPRHGQDMNEVSQKKNMTRRDFLKLAAVAFGGVKIASIVNPNERANSNEYPYIDAGIASTLLISLAQNGLTLPGSPNRFTPVLDGEGIWQLQAFTQKEIYASADPKKLAALCPRNIIGGPDTRKVMAPVIGYVENDLGVQQRVLFLAVGGDEEPNPGIPTKFKALLPMQLPQPKQPSFIAYKEYEIDASTGEFMTTNNIWSVGVSRDLLGRAKEASMQIHEVRYDNNGVITKAYRGSKEVIDAPMENYQQGDNKVLFKLAGVSETSDIPIPESTSTPTPEPEFNRGPLVEFDVNGFSPEQLAEAIRIKTEIEGNIPVYKYEQEQFSSLEKEKIRFAVVRELVGGKEVVVIREKKEKGDLGNYILRSSKYGESQIPESEVYVLAPTIEGASQELYWRDDPGVEMICSAFNTNNRAKVPQLRWVNEKLMPVKYIGMAGNDIAFVNPDQQFLIQALDIASRMRFPYEISELGVPRLNPADDISRQIEGDGGMEVWLKRLENSDALFFQDFNGKEGEARARKIFEGALNGLFMADNLFPGISQVVTRANPGRKPIRTFTIDGNAEDSVSGSKAGDVIIAGNDIFKPYAGDFNVPTSVYLASRAVHELIHTLLRYGVNQGEKKLAPWAKQELIPVLCTYMVAVGLMGPAGMQTYGPLLDKMLNKCNFVGKS